MSILLSISKCHWEKKNKNKTGVCQSLPKFKTGVYKLSKMFA